MTLVTAMRLSPALQRHLLIAGLLIVIIGLVAASETLHGRTADLVSWAEALISRAPLAGMLIFVLLAMASAMVAFFSSAVLSPVAILAWGQGITLFLLWTGWFLGGVVSFCIGRFFGRSVVAAIVDERKIESWEKELGERTRFVHILLFQALVPSEIPGYLLGILRYRFGWYVMALAITELPYALATVYLGESFLEGKSGIFIILGVTILLLTVAASRLYGRRPPTEMPEP